jgi:hypothetical protein
MFFPIHTALKCREWAALTLLRVQARAYRLAPLVQPGHARHARNGSAAHPPAAGAGEVLGTGPAVVARREVDAPPSAAGRGRDRRGRWAARPLPSRLSSGGCLARVVVYSSRGGHLRLHTAPVRPWPYSSAGSCAAAWQSTPPSAAEESCTLATGGRAHLDLRRQACVT